MNYRLITLKDGTISTIHKSKVDEFKAKGFKIGPEAKSPSQTDINHALMREKYGRAYVDEGRYAGKIVMVDKRGESHVVRENQIKGFQDMGQRFGDKKDIK